MLTGVNGLHACRRRRQQFAATCDGGGRDIATLAAGIMLRSPRRVQPFAL